jgi:response regulator NasT
MGYLLKPLRDGELLPTIELAVSHFQEFIALQKENENLKKTLEARKIIERAKGILMKSRGLSEAEAFSLIQKKSMDLRKPMGEIAQAVIVSEELPDKEHRASFTVPITQCRIFGQAVDSLMRNESDGRKNTTNSQQVFLQSAMA